MSAPWKLLHVALSFLAALRLGEGAHLADQEPPEDQSGSHWSNGFDFVRAVVGATGKIGTSRIMRAQHPVSEANKVPQPTQDLQAPAAQIEDGHAQNDTVKGPATPIEARISEDLKKLSAAAGQPHPVEAGPKVGLKEGADGGSSVFGRRRKTRRRRTSVRRRRTAAQTAGTSKPVDCVWGQWGAYSKCSTSCGWGKTTRKRTIATRPNHGGRDCVGSRREQKSCKYRNCPVQCKWGGWSAWTTCGASCGGGNMERTRSKVVVAEAGGKDCQGGDREKKACNTEKCPVVCEWASWGPWSECSKSCGGGESLRDRSIAHKAQYGGTNCSGSSLEKHSCNTQNCPVNCVWDTWKAWRPCSKTCGNGTTVRERTRKISAANGGRDCEGPPSETTSCNALSCPVDCHWGDWTPWTTCSRSCGKGERNRSRKRTVHQEHGGKICQGNSSATEVCNAQPCPVNCHWQNWGNWSACTKSCGGGMQTRLRENAPAKFGGTPCQGSAKEEKACNTDGCPVDCRWTEWSSWENCTSSCGGGVTTRRRAIAQQAAWGGQACTGRDSEEHACNTQGCAVDCHWSDWEGWTTCTKTCGAGHQSRTRFMVNRVEFGGKECTGGYIQNLTCNAQGCPVNCRWGDWSSWTACTVTCGNGTTSRIRAQEVHQANGGQACVGPSHAVSECNTEACPVDCLWGNWDVWSKCTASCGGGSSKRARSKVREAANGGRDCFGDTRLERQCNAQPCPVDCHWEEWGPWSSCSVTCGVGVKRRARPKLEEQYGGKGCFGSGTEDGQCFEEGANCPPSSYEIPPTEAPTPSPTPEPTPAPTPAPEGSQQTNWGTEAPSAAPTPAPTPGPTPAHSSWTGSAPTTMPSPLPNPSPNPSPNPGGSPGWSPSPGPQAVHARVHVSSSGSSTSNARVSPSPSPSASPSWSTPAPHPNSARGTSPAILVMIGALLVVLDVFSKR